MKKLLYFDPEKCSACGACSMACMDQNDTDIPAGEKPYRHIFTTAEDGALKYYSVSCMHCEDAPCIIACPCACLSKDESGFTVYDTTNCIGCHSCALACPFGVPSFGKDGKMQKCDACFTRQIYGYSPACVKVCPTGALKCLSEDEYNQLRNERLKLKRADMLNTQWAK